MTKLLEWIFTALAQVHMAKPVDFTIKLLLANLEQPVKVNLMQLLVNLNGLLKANLVQPVRVNLMQLPGNLNVPLKVKPV